jgi:hypothetical protein
MTLLSSKLQRYRFLECCTRGVRDPHGSPKVHLNLLTTPFALQLVGPPTPTRAPTNAARPTAHPASITQAPVTPPPTLGGGARCEYTMQAGQQCAFNTVPATILGHSSIASVQGCPAYCNCESLRPYPCTWRYGGSFVLALGCVPSPTLPFLSVLLWTHLCGLTVSVWWVWVRSVDGGGSQQLLCLFDRSAALFCVYGLWNDATRDCV